ncbi:MAG: hypothetical protein ACQETH_06270 [Candidatus Rifleibacteriota bacterium]
MSCQKLLTWIDQDNNHLDTDLPPELANHCQTCKDCRHDLQTLSMLKKAKSSLSPSDKDKNRLYKNCLNLINEENNQGSITTKISSIMNSILCNYKLTGSFALVLICFLLFYSAGYFASHEQANNNKKNISKPEVSYIKIHGTGKIIDQATKKAAEFSYQPYNIIELDNKKLQIENYAKLIFPDKGKIMITGNAELTILKNGFEVAKGTFKAEFQKQTKDFNILVPHARLVISGTVVEFNIGLQKAIIKLISGSAKIIPANLQQEPFIWEKGSVIHLKENELLKPEFLSKNNNNPPTQTSSDNSGFSNKSLDTSNSKTGFGNSAQ